MLTEPKEPEKTNCKTYEFYLDSEIFKLDLMSFLSDCGDEKLYFDEYDDRLFYQKEVINNNYEQELKEYLAEKAEYDLQKKLLL